MSSKFEKMAQARMAKKGVVKKAVVKKTKEPGAKELLISGIKDLGTGPRKTFLTGNLRAINTWVWQTYGEDIRLVGNQQKGFKRVYALIKKRPLPSGNALGNLRRLDKQIMGKVALSARGVYEGVR